MRAGAPGVGPDDAPADRMSARGTTDASIDVGDRPGGRVPVPGRGAGRCPGPGQEEGQDGRAKPARQGGQGGWGYSDGDQSGPEVEKGRGEVHQGGQGREAGQHQEGVQAGRPEGRGRGRADREGGEGDRDPGRRQTLVGPARRLLRLRSEASEGRPNLARGGASAASATPGTADPEMIRSRGAATDEGRTDGGHRSSLRDYMADRDPDHHPGQVEPAPGFGNGGKTRNGDAADAVDSSHRV